MDDIFLRQFKEHNIEEYMERMLADSQQELCEMFLELNKEKESVNSDAQNW